MRDNSWDPTRNLRLKPLDERRIEAEAYDIQLKKGYIPRHLVVKHRVSYLCNELALPSVGPHRLSRSHADRKERSVQVDRPTVWSEKKSLFARSLSKEAK
jgi:hypothetical protein